ncbi:YcgL domain-containing protein [Paraferrimonas sp. SM1919]|uniref:YcgL domain-containing protein n=1 Tax=Paraferrimonas sp. SM1919 TaxID=2662263 RepID=UPI0013D01AF3|nr:YcgL domain-containing protein [Paraferrimonas sp. SM1919]
MKNKLRTKVIQLCSVYKSSKKLDTYLYVVKRDDFSNVPSQLMELFGQPIFVMTLPLFKREHLGVADIEKVRQSLLNEGFYLQLPPPTVDELKAHKDRKKAQNN